MFNKKIGKEDLERILANFNMAYTYNPDKMAYDYDPILPQLPKGNSQISPEFARQQMQRIEVLDYAELSALVDTFFEYVNPETLQGVFHNTPGSIMYVVIGETKDIHCTEANLRVGILQTLCGIGMVAYVGVNEGHRFRKIKNIKSLLDSNQAAVGVDVYATECKEENDGIIMGLGYLKIIPPPVVTTGDMYEATIPLNPNYAVMELGTPLARMVATKVRENLIQKLQ